MAWIERVGNVHVHTVASDGTGDVERVAEAANRVGLDFFIITDHNAPPRRGEGWYGGVLVLVGQEVHDPGEPHRSHLLILGGSEDHSAGAREGSPQELIAAVRDEGALAFIAHPFEHAGAYSGEPEIDWSDWDATGYVGLEIWNYMSEFKSHLSEPAVALALALWPKLAIRGPWPETLKKWDDLLARGRVVGIGGSDAHANSYRLGPMRRRVFSYEHLFRSVNTHLLANEPWRDDLARDARVVYAALRRGRCFVGYDGLSSTWGFRFTAEYDGEEHTMGERLEARGMVRFRAQAPHPAHLRLIHNGFCVAETRGRELVHSSDAPGAYRVEAYRAFLGTERGWIFSNPILVNQTRHSRRQSPARG